MATNSIEDIQEAMMREDAQEFLQVANLGPTDVRVWFRIFGADFMASAKATRAGNVRHRTIRATASSRAGALEALASAVAAYLYPSAQPTGAVKE